jgi:hypothetical protein
MLLKQLLMIALLDHLASLHDENVVCVPNCGQSMRDHNTGDSARLKFHIINCFLHLSLVLFVQSRCGLVEDQKGRLFYKGASQSYTLLLAA